MSKLIDQLYHELPSAPLCSKDNKHWNIAKGVDYVTAGVMWQRVKDAWRVIRGKSFTVHYKVDE